MEFSPKGGTFETSRVACGWIRLDQEARLLELARNALGLFKSLLGNRLVIVAPADTALKLDIKAGFDLAGALKGGHLAMARPRQRARRTTGSPTPSRGQSLIWPSTPAAGQPSVSRNRQGQNRAPR